MLDTATQSTRQMAVATPFPADTLLLRQFSGTEELSRLFEYELEMVSKDDSLDPTRIVGENITWMLNQAGDTPRYWNAHVCRFRYAGQTDAGTTYRATVVPWLWFLTQTTDCRIFQNKTSPEIIEQIFKDLGFRDFQLQLNGNYEKREYCVQYRETDFNFVSRLMEEEGIYYFFEHQNAKHTLVLADDISSYFRLPDYDVEMADPDASGDLVDQITAWEHETRFRPGRWAQTDFNFKKPRTPLMSTTETVMPVPLTKKFEVYEYPGCFVEKKLGNNLTKIRMQEHEADHDVVFGECLYRTFTPGGRMKVKKHLTAAEVGKEFTVRKIAIEATVGGSYDSHLVASEDIRFRCKFECLPAKLVFRPARSTRKPVVEGPQTAIITGPPGEEIHPDEFGRVKAQFHWDREGKFDENSSCWLRVSQVHAGQGWGMMDLPRIQEEVIVSFLEGDPDRPIITGRVYNGDNMPPFALPAGKTRRGNTTKTHKGAGYNEMTMDDTVGKEQLRVNAQYDMNSNVNHDQTLNVGNDQTESVGNNRTRIVGNDETITINNDRKKSVVNNETTAVGVDRTETVGNNETVTVVVNRSLNVGADDSIQVGGNQSTIVGGNQLDAVGGNRTVQVAANQSTIVGANLANSIGASQSDSIGVNRSASVGLIDSANSGLITNLSAGLIMTLSAGVSLELSGPGGSIVIGPSGIHIKGKTVIIEGDTVHINP